MATFNNFCNFIVDALLYVVRGQSMFLQVFLVAIPASALVLLVFKFASNQAAIARAKDLIKANLLEPRVFSDDLSIVLTCQIGVLRQVFVYLFHSLRPTAVLIIPIGLLVAQIEGRFAFRSLEVGEPVTLLAEFSGKQPVSSMNIMLSLPVGLRAETPAHRDDQMAQVSWRLSGGETGLYTLEVGVGEEKEQVLISIETSLPVSRNVYKAGDVRSLAEPLQIPMSQHSSITRLEVEYPRARSEFVGLSSATWSLFAFLLILCFALRRSFRVTF